MISSLEDAWKWYTSVKDITLAMRALANKHWDALPWDGALGRDERLRYLAAPQALDQVEVIAADLDDLCVLLLFSVFEAIVRERALADVAAELPTPLRHPALQHAVRRLNEALEHGSFYQVTEAYKAVNPDLIEQVNQVRKYRNWVAHGRRDEPPNAVDPKTAYQRLKEFLNMLG